MWLGARIITAWYNRGKNEGECTCWATWWKVSMWHHNRFTALFPGPPGWTGARTELLDFMVQGKINRGTHADHPAGRHSIQTNQCPPPLSPIFYRPDALPATERPDALPATQPTVSKHWRQQGKESVWHSKEPGDRKVAEVGTSWKSYTCFSANTWRKRITTNTAKNMTAIEGGTEKTGY